MFTNCANIVCMSVKAQSSRSLDPNIKKINKMSVPIFKMHTFPFATVTKLSSEVIAYHQYNI